MTIFPWAIWAACVASAIFIVSQLSGCASTQDDVWHRVCYEQPLGQTEQGVLVVQHSCVTLEQFKAAQR